MSPISQQPLTDWNGNTAAPQVLIDAIVPAYNEESTIAGVIKVLQETGKYRITVVSDGSKDNTPNIAARAGARVIHLKKNGGKAQAMKVGLGETTSDPVAFFDADLLGFNSSHATSLYNGSLYGYDMVCGLRDVGIFKPFSLIFPLVTGERILRREVIARVPESCWNGYFIETALNHACSDKRILVLYMNGVTIRTKRDKFGSIEGLKGDYVMFRDIARISTNLDRCGECSACPVPTPGQPSTFC